MEPRRLHRGEQRRDVGVVPTVQVNRRRLRALVPRLPRLRHVPLASPLHVFEDLPEEHPASLHGVYVLEIVVPQELPDGVQARQHLPAAEPHVVGALPPRGLRVEEVLVQAVEVAQIEGRAGARLLGGFATVDVAPPLAQPVSAQECRRVLDDGRERLAGFLPGLCVGAAGRPALAHRVLPEEPVIGVWEHLDVGDLPVDGVRPTSLQAEALRHAARRR
mmetsp:Transcript_11612/g.32912  ORF Transcript_11612/g.32912 Transcript_11612/m.32912 type:complete len:219 (+) Transcript_11612:603-1259(+)